VTEAVVATAATVGAVAVIDLTNEDSSSDDKEL